MLIWRMHRTAELVYQAESTYYSRIDSSPADNYVDGGRGPSFLRSIGTGYGLQCGTTLVAQVSSLQSQLIATLGQIQALQVRDPAHVDDPEDADSSS
ncbi:hypothetical protein Tco_0195968 [Tanacetum coccineum]